MEIARQKRALIFIINTAALLIRKIHPWLYSNLGGFCSVALMQESLFRSSYQLAVVGPLEEMTDIFVVVIVKTRDKGAITGSVSGSGVNRGADNCKDVTGIALFTSEI